MDQIEIPSAQNVRTALEALSYAQVRRLSAASGVPLTTLWKMRTGETRNPGVDTVRNFWPHLDRAKSASPA